MCVAFLCLPTITIIYAKHLLTKDTIWLPNWMIHMDYMMII